VRGAEDVVEDMLKFDEELAVKVGGTPVALRNITLRVLREFQHPDWRFTGELTELTKGAEPAVVVRVDAKEGGRATGGGSIGIIEYEELFPGTTRIRIPAGRGAKDQASAWSRDPEGLVFSGILKALIHELLRLEILQLSMEPRPLGFHLPHTGGGDT
jgi:hypothetical protein